MSTRISQREARALRRLVAGYDQRERERLDAWARQWPNGIHIATVEPNVEQRTAVKTARRLGCAIVCTLGNEGNLYLHAVRIDGSKV